MKEIIESLNFHFDLYDYQVILICACGFILELLVFRFWIWMETK
jgi:hypothetical protein